MSTEGGDELDPEWTFDDEWVAAAAIREPPARARSAQAEYARQDAERAEQARREGRRRRRTRRAWRLGPIVAVLLCLALINVVDRNGSPQSAWSSPTDGGRAVYVTGSVTLDGPQIIDIMAETGDDRVAEDVVLHELGHLIGLDHVDDESELMYPQGQEDLHGLQRGDTTGLTRLGQGACVDQL